MSKILLTGGSGFIGSHFAKAVDCVCAPDPFWEFQFDSFETTTCRGYGGSSGTLIEHEAVSKGITTLVHLAAITDPQSSDEDSMRSVNWSKAISFFERAIRAGVRRIVYASSASVYGGLPAPQRENCCVSPLTVYAESKALLEASSARLSASTGVPIVGLRFSNVYGPGEEHKGKAASVVYQLVRQIRSGQRPVLFQWGEQLRDWVSVHDVVAALRAACERGSGVYNVGSGVGVSFNSVVSLINSCCGVGLETEYVENPFRGYQSHTCLDLSRTERELGWRPGVSLESGIMDLVKSETPIK